MGAGGGRLGVEREVPPLLQVRMCGGGGEGRGGGGG